MKRSTFRILFYIKGNNPKKNGNAVIMGRITIDGEKVQFSTKPEIHPDNWDNKEGKVKSKAPNAVNLNRMLDSIRAKSSMHYNRLMDDNGYFNELRI